MSWARLDDNFADHPKIVGLGDRAFRLHVAAILWSCRFATDGDVTAGLRTLAAALGASDEHVAELVAARVWERHGARVLIHDFLDFNLSRADVEARAGKSHEARVAGGRARASTARRVGGRFASRDDQQATSNVAGDELVPAHQPRPRPRPRPDPDPRPSPHPQSAQAREDDGRDGREEMRETEEDEEATWKRTLQADVALRRVVETFERTLRATTKKDRRDLAEALRLHPSGKIVAAIDKTREAGGRSAGYVRRVLDDWRPAEPTPPPADEERRLRAIGSAVVDVRCADCGSRFVAIDGPGIRRSGPQRCAACLEARLNVRRGSVS